MAKILISNKFFDPYFDNVSLSLPFNSNFQDISKNNFTVTVNGNAQISNTESKYGGGSALFDGSGDYLELPLNSAFDFDSGDFTIECWFYSLVSGFQTLIARWGSGGNAFFLGFDTNSNNVQLYVNDTAAVFGGTPQINQWNHVAAIRNGSDIKLFLNGVQVGSTYDISNNPINSTTEKLRIGDDNNGGNPGTTGYIDEVRITKGVARYTSNFNPSQILSLGKLKIKNTKVGKLKISKPVFPIKNLLAFWRFNDLTDSSGNNYTLNNNGSSVQFVAGKIGNCAQTDGSNYLSRPHFTINGSFSVSFWMKVTSGYGGYNIGVNQYPGFIVFPTAPFDGSVQFSDFASWGVSSPTGVIQSDTWHHYCLVTNDTSTTLYIDGVNVASSSVHLCSMANPQRVFGIFGNEIDGTYGGNSKGSIDALGIWDRALSEQEVLTLYNNGSGLEL